MTPEQAAALRAPFPPEAIGKLPRAGTKLDYVGHAAVTDRLLQVDPEWTWEPVAWAADGTPFWSIQGNDAVMWIRLTVAGVTRIGVGTAKASAFELEKQLISDALRNSAMRFGVALDLWAKEDLSGHPADNSTQGLVESPSLTPDNSGAATSPNQKQRLNARAAALAADGVDVGKLRKEHDLPTIDKSDAKELAAWNDLLLDAEEGLSAPFDIAEAS